jgi:tRNA (mo5U34)-methyltransferase
MDIDDVASRVGSFEQRLRAVKSAEPNEFWYPYGTLANIGHLQRLLGGNAYDLMNLAEGRAVADIGAADGDLAFFLETLGFEVDIVDNAPTNWNGLKGARRLRELLDSRVKIEEVDLDAQFRLPRDNYGLIFFLGILYHLQNPYYALSALARATRHVFISTRIAQVTTDHSVRFADVPVAYLVHPTECNNDPSNYWIFSDAGLRRILSRTGWEVLEYIRVGQTVDSDPATAAGDERVFCLARSQLVR